MSNVFAGLSHAERVELAGAKKNCEVLIPSDLFAPDFFEANFNEWQGFSAGIGRDYVGYLFALLGDDLKSEWVKFHALAESNGGMVQIKKEDAQTLRARVIFPKD